MTELLRKWAQHEPERCSFDGDTCRLAWRLDEPGDTTKAEMNNAMTLAAVIEAIEARRWEWCIERMRTTTGFYYEAYVAPHPSRPSSLQVLVGSDHVKPLLTAYLAALEAEADQ